MLYWPSILNNVPHDEKYHVPWWFVCVCVCSLNMAMSCAKTAELIEMPFGVYTRVGPRNHEAAQIPQGRGNFCMGASGDATFRRNPLATCIVRFYGTPWRRSTARAAVGTEFLSPYSPHTHTHGDPHGDPHIPTAESRADLSNARNGGLITPVASLAAKALKCAPPRK